MLLTGPQISILNKFRSTVCKQKVHADFPIMSIVAMFFTLQVLFASSISRPVRGQSKKSHIYAMWNVDISV
jgi:hypothetical protein